REVTTPNELQRERGFNSFVAQLSAVQNDLRESTRWCRGAIEQEICRASLVRGHLERRAAAPWRRVEATLELFHPLGLDVRCARDAGDVRADVASDDRRRQGRELLTEQRLIARLAVRATQLELAALTEQAWETERRPGLREDIKLARVPEHAAPLGAEAGLDR